MTISLDDVRYIAHLARLKINEADLEKYAKTVTNILSLAEQMQALDTQNINPMSHPLDLNQRSRADVVTEKNQREAFQKIAPEVESGLYLVPKVIE